MATHSIEMLGEELLVGEMSLFLNIRDLRLFLATNRLYSIYPGVRRKLFQRYLAPHAVGDITEVAIRVVLGRLRHVMERIAQMESDAEEFNIVCQINDVCDFFCLLPQSARSALERFLPSLRSHVTLRNHCLESLHCRLDELKANDDIHKNNKS